MKMPIFLLWFILMIRSVYGQQAFNPEEVKNDLDSLVYHIESAHPNPYYRYPKLKFSKDVENAKLGIQKPMTYMEFYFIAQRLVAKLEDGHIDLELPLDIFKKSQTSSFPFDVLLNVTKPFITIKNASPSEIPSGAEIVSINAVPAKKIVQDIVNLVTGEAAAFRASYGARNFDFYINQLYPNKGTYQLKYIHHGRMITKRFSGKGDKKTEQQSIPTAAPKAVAPPFKLETIKSGTALMTLKDFIDLEKLKPFADSAFAALKRGNTSNLIIDLRDNLGGDSDVGDYLLQYLLNTPFSQYDVVLEKNSQLLKKRLLSHRIGKALSASDSALLAKRNGSVDTVKNGTDPLLDLPNRFNGKVYLLINSQTFSSAADFAQAFSHYKRGPLIGEETGGLILSFGDIVPGVLPNTKMPFVVSSKLYLNIGAKVDDWHGVIPSIPIKSDEALKKALLLID